MPQARSKQVSLEITPYYHCVSRCVRRAFLCGKDALTKKSFEHRRDWLENKLLTVSQSFMIDIVSYAVMSNHYHVILCVDKEGAKNLAAQEVIARWHQLFNGNDLSKAYIEGEKLEPFQQESLNTYIEVWRKRLTDISWLMRTVNEAIARLANQEDNCTGRFWEGRFKSQALLDEKALLACMAYVDLNPFRANMASNLEDSDYTSIQRRLNKDRSSIKQSSQIQSKLDLFSFNKKSSDELDDKIRCLPFNFADYISLLEWTMAKIRKSPNSIAKASLLTKHAFNEDLWVYSVQNFESQFKTLVGGLISLKSACSFFKFKRTVGITACQRLIDT